ncbi:hypothetical protein [Diaphorobacter caeni]|uniref:hypothetical protein n=1 Tax=Diaphorobacter caeni TaxID=2784387 RepID=UPI00188FD7F6|nr:hypothetical protein [Diaphorobacter caeni]MBF5007637.1 hypothetical protein [Diaphorobacter caeni]
MTAQTQPCKHMQFDAQCRVARLEDSGRFMLEVGVRCIDCGKPFQFLGLQPGLNLSGATASLDGLEANIAICPQGVQPTPLQGLQGYTIEGHN